MGNVLEFIRKQPEEDPEPSTIVEKLELTDELRAEFEAAGYTIEEDSYEDEEDAS